MAKITISNSNQAGDIPTYNFTKQEIQDDFFTEVYDQLEFSGDKVFVCFQSWSQTEGCKYEDEHQSFLVTKWTEDANDFMIGQIKDLKCEEINFNFFCFETFEEAFKYCIDLKEGL